MEDIEQDRNYPLNIEPSPAWRLKRPIIAVFIMTFFSSLAGLITLVFSESIYVSTVVGLSVLLFMIVVVAFYYALRAIEYYNFLKLARFAKFALTPVRIGEMVLRKIYLY